MCRPVSNTHQSEKMVVHHSFPFTARAQVNFQTRRKKPASSVVKLHVDTTISVGEEEVSVTVHSLGAHSNPLHLEEDKYVGPCPVMVAYKAKALSGTEGHPRCSRGPGSGNVEVTADNTVSKGAQFEPGLELPHSPHVNLNANYEKKKSVQTKKSIDDVSWAGDHDDSSARYSGTANMWKRPVD